MDVSTEQLSLISRIYDLVLDPKNWSDVLDQLARSTDARYANLVLSDLQYPEINVGAASFDEDIQKTYREIYAPTEQGMAVSMLEFPAHQVPHRRRSLHLWNALGQDALYSVASG